MNLFCFGLGYTANHLIRSLSPVKWQFSGSKRTGKNRFNTNEPLQDADKILKKVTHLLISIPPDKNISDPVLFHHKKDIENMPNLKWIGYLSATSVYGNYNGDWVDEQTPLNPTGQRGKNRLDAEKLWLSLDRPVHIFRLAGIYGPDRNQIDSVRNGTARKIIKPGHVFSRVHVDDICSALIRSMEQPAQKEIYNIADDCPAATADILDFICQELNLPPIEGELYENSDISPALRSFYQDNKRVKNDYAKRDLNWQPKFPSYKEGYRDILTKLV
ncbi:MAG: SDR family oxidoreductase [Alphaproteobacteria bacterium]|nr:SDR family oxidoreductase [Alphaproteobacteria bacterium]HPF46034.1 SDR family oxidoreductase [Emcibacteraceae bacterium]HRW28800.1 SDR family oxidoreductase [Emcibacteraceae bacterium]